MYANCQHTMQPKDLGCFRMPGVTYPIRDRAQGYNNQVKPTEIELCVVPKQAKCLVSWQPSHCSAQIKQTTGHTEQGNAMSVQLL